MPWHVDQSDSCPASKPWAVIKDSDGSVAGCHASKDDAQTQLAALYASESSATRFAVAPIMQVEIRDAQANGDNTWTMTGYAAVFNELTTLFDSKFVRLTESIHPAAFQRVFAEQPLTEPAGVVHFNIGHDMNRVVAATDVPAGQPGHLGLEADHRGLRFHAKVARDDPDGVALAAKMRAGVIKQASFAFTVSDSRYTSTAGSDGQPDVEHREILELSHLYDVCATPQGAYSGTVSALRSYASAIGRPSRSGGGATTVDSDLEGGNAVGSDFGTEGGGAHTSSTLLLDVDETLARVRQAAFLGGILKG